MICPNCRAQINDGDTFCSYCGAMINRQTQNNTAEQTGSFPAQQNSYVPQQNNFNTPQNFNQPNTNAAQQAAAKDTNPVLIFIITMMTGLMLFAAFLLFIKPGYLVHKSDPETAASESDNSKKSNGASDKTKSEKTTKKTKKENSKEEPESKGAETTKKSSEDSSEGKTTTKKETDESSEEEVTTKKTKKTAKTEKPKETEKTSKTEKTEKPSETEKPTDTSKKEETTKPPETTSPPETTAPPETTRSEIQQKIEDDRAAYSEAMSYDTSERPSFDEFEWCYGQYGLIYAPPEGADMITNPLGYSGGWKSMIIYNPTNSSGSYSRELDNVIIGINSGAVDMTIDWYYFEEPFSESYDMSGDPDTLFLGNTFDGGFSVSSTDYTATIVLSYFWKADGKEYALGTIATADGIPAYIALVRP